MDWFDYDIEKTDIECNFYVTGTIEEPAENPMKVPYVVLGTAVYENDRWVLTEMIL